MNLDVIRLLLIDDRVTFRIPLAMLLEREHDLIVLSQAGSVDEARAKLQESAGMVDIALVDLHLPDGSGVEIIRDVKATNPEGRVIILTADTNKQHHAWAIEEGAVCILTKSVQPSEIVDAIRRAHVDTPV